jgi:hypothetical protein
MAHALGIRRGEHGRHVAAFGDAKQRSALDADGVHHRADIVHAVIERGITAVAIGRAGAAFVEHHDAREGGQARNELGEVGIFPHHLDAADPAGRVDERERRIADHLVGDADIAALGVTRARRLHDVPLGRHAGRLSRARQSRGR